MTDRTLVARWILYRNHRAAWDRMMVRVRGAYPDPSHEMRTGWESGNHILMQVSTQQTWWNLRSEEYMVERDQAEPATTGRGTAERRDQ